MLFEPCGELRRDYGAYCETLRLTEREDVFSAIFTNEEVAREKERRRKLKIMAEAGLEGENAEAEAEALLLEQEAAAAAAAAVCAAGDLAEALPHTEPTPPLTSRGAKKGRGSDSGRGKKGAPAKNAEPVAEDASEMFAIEPVPTLTFIRIRHPKFCINQRDITPLCRSIPFCSSLVSIEFTGAGLSPESYMLLTEALYRSRRVVRVCVDFNGMVKPGFVPDPTVAPPEWKSSRSGSIFGANASLTTAAGVSMEMPPAAPTGAADLPRKPESAEKKKGSGGKKDRRLSLSGSAQFGGTVASGPDSGRGLSEESGVLYLKPTEYCGLHLIPTTLEEQINDEKEKKGKVDPKKLALLQTQQEAIQRFNETHRIRVPRSWEGILFTAVRHLSLRGNDIDDDCVARMVRLIGLNPNSHLISLNLWGNKITDAGASIIARLLKTNRSLRALDLGHNLLSDRGLIELIDVFRMMEMSTMDEINAYRRRVLTRSTASEKERAAALQPMASSIPTYQDMYNVWHALRFPPVVEEKGGKDSGGSGKRGNASKGKTKEAPPPTLVRPAQPFDRDCIRVAPGDPCIRVPGNSVLEVLNLAENALVSVYGIQEAARILSLHEPRTDEEMVLLTLKPAVTGGREEENHMAESGPPSFNDTAVPVPTSTLLANASKSTSFSSHYTTSAGATSLTSPSQQPVYAPELHCAGLRLRTCTLFHYHYDPEECQEATTGRWEEMTAAQQKVNESLNEWLACGLDAQKPPPPDKMGSSGRRKNH